MQEAETRSGLNRRDALLRAIALVGGVAGVGVLEACSQSGPFFNQQRMAIVDEVCELMIPTTDTPGARAAGVPAFIDGMMQNWASRETRGQFVDVVDAFDDRAREMHNVRFMTLEPAQRLEVLRAHDAASLEDPENPYRRFKELILLGYYHSEIGATQELRYELVPGAFHGDIPFSDVGRAWAS